jgi:hypothetical protein
VVNLAASAHCARAAALRCLGKAGVDGDLRIVLDVDMAEAVSVESFYGKSLLIWSSHVSAHAAIAH